MSPMLTSTRFSVFSDMRIVPAIIIAALLACWLGCNVNRDRPDPTIIAAQKASLEELERYMLDSDWQKRQRIEESKGPGELVASRIFRAFTIVSYGKSPNDDEHIVDVARNVLFENPEMTLAILKPIVFESATKEQMARMSEGSHPRVSEDNTALFFSICRQIAAFEVSSNALQILETFSKCGDDKIENLAQGNLKLAVEENWRAKKAIYEKGKSAEALNWFGENVLRRGLTRHDVEIYMGKGVESPDFQIEYSGHFKGKQFVLQLQYIDSFLNTWRVAPLQAQRNLK